MDRICICICICIGTGCGGDDRIFTPLYSTARVLCPESCKRRPETPNAFVPLVTDSDFPGIASDQSEITCSPHSSNNTARREVSPNPMSEQVVLPSSDLTPVVQPSQGTRCPLPSHPVVLSETAQIHARLRHLTDNLPQMFPSDLREEIKEVMHLCSPRALRPTMSHASTASTLDSADKKPK
jgi:hypothetical protein